MEPARTNSSIEKASRDIEQLYHDNAIDSGLYAKCIVSLAYEYMENQEPDLALELLLRCGPKYYKDAIVKHMAEDSMFRDCVIRLTYNLVRAGYIQFETDPLETITPTAKA